MQKLEGRGAFVTGAANGIGRAIACALAQAGAEVMLADLDAAALDAARQEVEGFGVRAHALVLDVSDRAAVLDAAARAEAALGRVHILVNNAGVSLGPVPIAALDDAQWDWILGVNLRGVANGIAAFLPRLGAHGEEAHIVNTASIGGLQVNPGLRNGSYCATKYAVVALSETLALDLAGGPIGVSVLCPGAVPTTLARSAERRPARFGAMADAAAALLPGGARQRATGEAVEPELVGRRVVHAIRNDEFFIFTHPHTRDWIEARHARLLEGFSQLDAFLAESSA